VDIGGRRLYLACKGSGTPTVILEAGANDNGTIWSEVDPKAASKTSVFDGVAQFTRVCARPGTIAGSETILRSRSDPAPMPRNASDFVADLSALLAAVGVRPPYVLVGHSFGGLAVRLFASTLPSDDVVGLVLVDAAQEEFWAKLEALVRAEQWKGMIAAPPPPSSPTTMTSKGWTSMRARRRCARPRGEAVEQAVAHRPVPRTSDRVTP
jgi:pimeloyl-ACP methyl ester carboxylesterase